VWGWGRGRGEYWADGTTSVTSVGCRRSFSATLTQLPTHLQHPPRAAVGRHHHHRLTAKPLQQLAGPVMQERCGSCHCCTLACTAASAAAISGAAWKRFWGVLLLLRSCMRLRPALLLQLLQMQREQVGLLPERQLVVETGL
jgi:hypothetical protein